MVPVPPSFPFPGEDCRSPLKGMVLLLKSSNAYVMCPPELRDACTWGELEPSIFSRAFPVASLAPITWHSSAQEPEWELCPPDHLHDICMTLLFYPHCQCDASRLNSCHRVLVSRHIMDDVGSIANIQSTLSSSHFVHHERKRNYTTT